MNAVAKIEPKAKPALTTGNHVAAMVPNSIESAWRLSEVIAASGMAPKTYGTDPNKIMVGMLAGMEIGLTPFAALQSIAVINGNPSLWGDGALALVLASNLVDDMDESDDGETATCIIKRIGRVTPIVRTFSMADAKRAGLAGKQGPWQTNPARMRQMRARGFAIRDGFPDVLKGLRIAEEVRDYADFTDSTPRPATGAATPLTGAMLIEQASDDATPNRPSDPVLPPVVAGDPTNDAGQPEAASTGPARKTALELADEYVARMEAMDSAVEIGAFEAAAATWLEKLAASKPDLREHIRVATAARLASLEGEAGDEAWRGNPLAGG